PAAARFEPVAAVTSKPSTAGRASTLALTDLNGSGNLCAVSFAPPHPGWYERDPIGEWRPFRSFATTTNVDWSSPNLRFVDLDGDGLADVLLTEDDALEWHQWVVESGFAPAQRAPKAWNEDDGPALVL